MSLESYLENLRAKPMHIRKHIALWTSLGVSLVIFMFWLGSFTALGIGAQNSVKEAVAKAGSPISLVAGAGQFASDIKDMIFGPQKIKYSEVKVFPGDR